MTDLNLDRLEEAAKKQSAAVARMMDIGEGVGGLGVRHPAMFEGMMAWDDATENGHADTVLAILARVRELEATVEKVRALANKWPNSVSPRSILEAIGEDDA